MTATQLWLSTAPLALLSAIALVVLGIVFFDLHSPLLSVGLFCGAAVALAYRLRLTSAGGRARILSGNSPFWATHAPWPGVEQDLVDEVEQIMVATGQAPVIVGCGWGLYIGRRAARGALFTHHLRGRVVSSDHPLHFYCGTTIAELSDILNDPHVIPGEYHKDGLTFWSTPTHQNVSIGSWLGRSCHGNSGAAGRPSNFAAQFAHVIHMKTCATARFGVQRIPYKEAADLMDRRPHEYFLVSIEFDKTKLASNGWVQKSMMIVPSDPNVNIDLKMWLQPETVLRVLFFGAARNHGVGITYTPVMGLESAVSRRQCGCCGVKVPHIDPHPCSRACMSMQLDTFSIVGGWYNRTKRGWRGITRLKDANTFSPSGLLDALPLIPLVVTWTGLLNFEFIFVLRKSNLNRTTLSQHQMIQGLCNVIINLFSGRDKLWGRCELRIGNLDRGIIFVDTILRESDALEAVKALAYYAHNGHIALHSSKYQSSVLETAIAKAGLNQVRPRQIYAMAKQWLQQQQHAAV